VVYSLKNKKVVAKSKKIEHRAAEPKKRGDESPLKVGNKSSIPKTLREKEEAVASPSGKKKKNLAFLSTMKTPLSEKKKKHPEHGGK